jgi:hypothetical protein
MIIKRIGNFSIYENEQELSLHYSLSLKDWFDFFTQLFVSIIMLTIGFAFLYSIYSEFKMMKLIIGLLLSSFGLFTILHAFSMIVRVRKNIIMVNKTDRKLIHRKTLFTSKKYEIADIRRFIILEKDEQAYTTRKSIRHIYSTVELELKDNKTRHLLTVNTKRIFRLKGNSVIKSEVADIAKSIAKELNNIKKRKILR